MASKLRKFWDRVTSWSRPTWPMRTRGVSAGALVTEDTAMKVAAYYRGLIYIATSIAKLPWEVKDAKNNVVNSKVSALLSLAPNEEMSSFHFKLLMVISAINEGNFYAEIERSTIGTPIAMWPIESYRVTPRRDENNRLYYEVRPGNMGGATKNLYPRDVFKVPNFYTKDGITGQGLVAYARDTLGISLSADKMAGDMFKNGGVPAYVLSHPGKLSPEAAQRLEESLKDIEGGGTTNGGVKVLEEGMIIKALNIDPASLQFLESRKFGVVEIARFLGLPPSKLYDTTNTKADVNPQESNLDVAVDTLDAWVTNIESETNIKLLTYSHGGLKAKFNLKALFRGNLATMAEYYSKMMQNGAISPNEIREDMGEAGYAGGEKFFIAVNNYTPIDRLDEVIDAQISKGKGSSNNADNEPTVDPKKTKTSAKVDDAVVKFLESRSK